MRVNTLFLGSDWESLETLKALNEDPRFNLVGVITPEDKPVGRKQILTASKVKQYALENGIEVFHTNKDVTKYQEALDMFNPELVVCKAFGEIVPKFFLEYPKYKCINVHFSLLPKYRGAVPIQKAILDGEKKTGISIMLMSQGLDEGAVLEIFEEDISDTDTNITLRERLVKKSAEVLGDVLERWVDGDIVPVPQDDEMATYCWQKDISKENAQISWDGMDGEYIERMVRALLPWPVAWTVLEKNDDERLKDKRLKILKAELIDTEIENVSGKLFAQDNMLLISTKDGKALRLKALQLEGKTEMTEEIFLNGFRDSIS